MSLPLSPSAQGTPLAETHLRICHLYPEHLNLYGDRGNLIALTRRAAWYGVGRVELAQAGPGDPLDFSQFDLLFIGGGQDQQQGWIVDDLLRRGDALRAAVEDGMALLAVCGGYQLLGRSYEAADGRVLPGVGLFAAHTVSGPGRLTGNVLAETDLWPAGQGERLLVGFENHGGRTWLEREARPLAQVRVGYGNNGRDGTEGAVTRHAVGTYLHGSLLPKNPALADWLLRRAMERRYGPLDWPQLDDERERAAHRAAVERAQQARPRLPRLPRRRP